MSVEIASRELRNNMRALLDRARDGGDDTRGARDATLNEAQVLDPVPIDGRVAAIWAQLRVSLRDRGRSMPVNDSWIAATAIALGVAVVSQYDDFAGVPGLELIRV